MFVYLLYVHIICMLLTKLDICVLMRVKSVPGSMTTSKKDFKLKEVLRAER